jgi:hypothetical protein
MIIYYKYKDSKNKDLVVILRKSYKKDLKGYFRFRRVDR